jgi:hypothetical protein
MVEILLSDDKADQTGLGGQKWKSSHDQIEASFALHHQQLHRHHQCGCGRQDEVEDRLGCAPLMPNPRSAAIIGYCCCWCSSYTRCCDVKPASDGAIRLACLYLPDLEDSIVQLHT